MSSWLILAATLALLPARPGLALEDPTRPPAGLAARAAEDGAPVHQLTAILGRDESRMAVIDGHTLREGDRLGADTVTRIEATRVELHGPEGTVELTLYGPPVKKPVAAARKDR